MDIDIKKIYRLEFWVAALIFCLFLVLDVLPLCSRMVTLLLSVNTLQQSAQTLSMEEKNKIRQGLLDQQKSLDSGFESMRGIVETVQQKISGEKNIPNIIIKLEELATASGIDLLSIKPSTEESKGSFDSVLIALEFESEYPQLADFLSRWVDTPFYLAVEELTVTKPKETTSKVHVDLKLNVLFKIKQEIPVAIEEKKVKSE